ncbi:bifunctional homocysteine S-methyltransferase/methylenetetrahydrofolate reductase [bacterium]|nr:bifunctional homocysteine S-methyltransferase/methylenetetrahydrofolate reductase [bacterium]
MAYRDILEIIEEKILVADGAMGTMLYSMGIPKGHCYDELNSSHPEVIKNIHTDYINAGAELIETNTFGANRYILEKYFDLGSKTMELNHLGAKLAREIAGNKALVGGSVGPITRPFESTEILEDNDIRAYFKEQVSTLIEGGVDIIIFETIADLDELIEGIKALKEVDSKFPCICQLSFVQEGKTLLGYDPFETTTKLNEFDVPIIGANCGQGAQEVFDAIVKMNNITEKKLSAMPNAGLPTFSNAKFMYPSSPEYMAKYSIKLVKAGVSIVGGCCGTTPAHIAAIAKAVRSLKPQPRKVIKVPKVEAKKPAPPLHPPSSLRRKLHDKFVLTMEIDPPRGTDPSKEVEAARRFKELGGDAINIADAPLARLRMSPLPLAHIINSEVGIDVILHFTCRDRNTLAITSDLIGAYSLGIDNILALHGDPPSVGDYPFATAVFEITSKGLVEIITALNNGKNRLGIPLPGCTSFFVGVAFNPTAHDIDKQFANLNDKIKKGAHFLQTQPIYEPSVIEKIKPRLDDLGIPVIVSLLPIANSRHAEFLHNEVPGISIPDWIRNKFENANESDEEIGIDISLQIMNGLKELVNGVCIMPPFKKYFMAERILSSFTSSL